jgi:outer membrane protein assembly factor BamB
LGYGDGDEATTIASGKSKEKFVTSYFRHAFELPDGASFDAARLNAKIDDGAVFYLNGQEAGRLFMPSGEVSYDTFAGNTSSEDDFHALPFDSALLKPGKNLLAVEVHQRSRSSSDVSFDLELLVSPSPRQEPSNAVDDIAPAETYAGEILKLTDQHDGFCLVVGGSDKRLIEELAELSHLQVIVIEENVDVANELRRKLQHSEVLGRRVAVLNADAKTMLLPPYLCNLIVASPTTALDPSGLTNLYQTLRPYGGVIAFHSTVDEHEKIVKSSQAVSLPNAVWSRVDELTMLQREGALPNSAPWTHHGAAVQNTMMSHDLRVKAPLGLLWFGGPSHEGILPRHGHGPTPQVVGGRLFIEGRDFLRAVDVYTGRLLWQRELPGVGMYYDNTGHHPGANAIGSNYVSLDDGVYVAYGRECLRLDPATGETLSTFTLPKVDGEKETPFFGYIGVYDDVLIAGSSPTVPWTKSHGVDAGELQSRFAEGSARLVALDRNSGQPLWQRTANYNFRHNAICAGGGRVYCIDRLTDARMALLKRRGVTPSGEPTLYAMDAITGKVVWQDSDDIFGTWLTYSDKHDILVQATASFRDRAKDEPDSGMAAHEGKSGKRLWRSDAGYGGPVLLTGETIITQGTAFKLHTGEHATRDDPITGQATRWTFSRNYGCNSAIGCPNLLTFRSAAAGFFDLESDGGTGNLGGFRSSCTSNLVPADGVLNAPDYTRTCSCSYQLQCSLALVHMPSAEMWTFQPDAWNGDRVKRLGINFGAPGDRRAEDGTLWIDYPSVGGRSPDVPIQIEGDDLQYSRRHASGVGDHKLAWVAASGVTGARKVVIKIAIDDEKPRDYMVRLVWSDEEDVKSLSSLEIVMQGKRMARNLNGEGSDDRNHAVVVETFSNVPIGKELEITIAPSDEKNTARLCGIELVQR